MEICMKEEATGAAAAAPALKSPTAAIATDFISAEATDASMEAAEEAVHANDHQITNEPAVSLHPLKIPFYEAVAKQLLDDE